MQRPRGRELGKANKVAEWNGEVSGVSVKGERIRWEVASSRRLQKEREAREEFWRAGLVGSRSSVSLSDRGAGDEEEEGFV